MVQEFATSTLITHETEMCNYLFRQFTFVRSNRAGISPTTRTPANPQQQTVELIMWEHFESLQIKSCMHRANRADSINMFTRPETDQCPRQQISFQRLACDISLLRFLFENEAPKKHISSEIIVGSNGVLTNWHRFGTVLASFCNRFDIVLEPFLHRVVTMLALCWNSFCIVLEPVWHRVAIVVASRWHRFGILFEHFWNRFWFVVVSCWNRVGIVLE